MNFKRLQTFAEVSALIAWHNIHSEFLVLDTETTSTKPREAKLLDIQISGRIPEEAFIFDAVYAKELSHIEPTKILVAHHYIYDAKVLLRHGVDLLSYTWRDTLLLGHLADENRESYSLGSYVKEIWNDNYKEEFWSKYKTYEEAPEEDQKEYACKDIFYTGKLFRRLSEASNIPSSLVEHVHRLQAALLQTEIEGIKVDLEYLTEIGIKLKTEIERLKPLMRGKVELQCELWEMEEYAQELGKRKTDRGKAGVSRPEFSFDSTKQLGQLLYTLLDLPTQFDDKTRKPTTGGGALDKIKDLHPVIPLIQEYKQNQKIYTAFIEGTRERVENGRIYPEFRVSGTVTGRISHSNPNLGQLPKSGGVRGIYVPNDGMVLISADYSQLEVCLEANLTGDKQLARIFEEGLGTLLRQTYC